MKKLIIKNQPFIFSWASSAGLIMATLVLGTQPSSVIPYTILPSLVGSILFGHAMFRNSFLHWGKLPPFKIALNTAYEERKSDFQQKMDRKLILENRIRLGLWVVCILILLTSLTYKLF